MMQKRRNRFLSLSWWDVVIAGISSWVIGKILDKANSEIQRRAKQRQVLRRFSLWRIIYFSIFLPVYFSGLYLVCDNSDDVSDPVFRFILEPLYSGEVKPILIIHKLLHEKHHLKTDICVSCKMITLNQRFLQMFASDHELYPPFRS